MHGTMTSLAVMHTKWRIYPLLFSPLRQSLRKDTSKHNKNNKRDKFTYENSTTG
jgi:hypothetical protein